MLKVVLPLSVVIFFRFFGLFIVLPVLSVHLALMPNANAMLIGIAMSGYALMQLLFQVPFGYLSDKIGRKVAIIIGTIIFVVGSSVCYMAEDIYWLIAGRLLQGAGAVAAVIAALVSDLVKEEVRFKAMALIGGSIAIGFSISMIIGPILNGIYGVSLLFLLSAIFGAISLWIVIAKVPNPPKVIHHYNAKPELKKIFFEPSLVIMNITNFLQKAIMTFTFVIVPISLIQEFGWGKDELYTIYLPATILGIFAMGPASIIAEKKHKPKMPLFGGIILFALAYILMSQGVSLAQEALFLAGVVSFFIGFNIHEPILQSITSKLSKVHQKGLSLGIFNTFGYLGTFSGGILGALIIKSDYLPSFVMIFSILSIMWFILIWIMKNPALSKNVYIPIAELKAEVKEGYQVPEQKGILEYYINDTEQLLIIKYDSTILSPEAVTQMVTK